jgi:hypothetical protein
MNWISTVTAFFLICTLVSWGLAQLPNDFVDYGVAADVARSRGATATIDGDGNRVVLIWMSDQRGTTALLVVDAVTGETESVSFERPLHDSPFAVLHSSKDKFYSQFANRFYEFDPLTRSFTFIGDTPSRCAMSMTEDDDGVIWAGLFPDSHLVSFNPESRELVDHGSLNQESWRQYPRALAYDEAGWIYAGIGNTAGQVVGYNSATGEIRKYIAEDQRGHGRGVVFTGTDGQVYATGPGWSWHILHNGEPTALEAERPPVSAKPIKTGAQESVFKDFPDGSRIVTLNVPERHLKMEDADGTVRDVAFDYQSEGAGILSIHKGPDGALYGSTGHPLRLYRLDPLTGELSNHGLKGYLGHLNAMASQRGIVFGARYGGGALHGYDISKPWQDRDEDDPNPRLYGQSAPDINRPHVLLAHPDGRHLIMGGTPGYGRTGGGMFIYDLEADAGQVLSHDELLENLSVYSLVALPDGNLVGGTTIAPGTGGAVKAEQAELFIFDFDSRTVVWREPIIPGVASIADLLIGPDGLIYGMAAGSKFFVFDAESRTVVHREQLAEVYGELAGAQAPRIMTLGPDENIYVLFREAIVRIQPGSFEHTKLADSPVSIRAGVELIEGRLYFTSGSHVWSYKVPGL